MKSTLVLRYVVLSVLALFFLLPFFVILRNAFSTQQHIASPQWQWLPNQLDLTNLQSLLANDTIGIGRAVVNSAVTASLQTVLTIVVSLMAGYALSRWTHRLARILLAACVFTGSLIAVVPMLIVFLVLQRWLVQGFTTSGLR